LATLSVWFALNLSTVSDLTTNDANVDAGNFAAPQVFRAQDAPRYTLGFIVVLVTAIIAGIIILIYRFICAHENRRRDASGTSEAFEHAYEDDLTDNKVGRIYQQVQKMILIIFCRTHSSDMFYNLFGAIPNGQGFCLFVFHWIFVFRCSLYYLASQICLRGS
jgi:hypothetical protein